MKKNISSIAFAADVVSKSVDTEKRTVDVVFATGQQVRRDTWMDGEFIQELSLNPEHIRMGRFEAGAPVLDTHKRYTIKDVYGVVERAWVADGKGYATLRFSDRAEVEPYWQDVKGGIIRAVSVGGRVFKYEDVTPKSAPGEPKPTPHYLAVDWEPQEVSLVAVGADTGALVVRSEGDTELYECEFISRADSPRMEEETMTIQNSEQGGAGTVSAPVVETPASVDIGAVQRAERERIAECQRIGTALALNADVVEGWINNGTGLEEVRRAAVDAAVAQRANAPETRSGVIVTQEHDSLHNRLVLMSEALVARGMPHRSKPSEAAVPFMRVSLTDMAREIIRAQGRTPFGVNLENKWEVIRAALHTTSDFPLLLADSANKMLLAEYNQATPVYRSIAGRKTFSDFKPHSFLRSGDFPMLLQTNEHGEFQYGTMSERREQMTLLTWGRIIGFTRQTLVNDDLGAFGEVFTKMARRVVDFENATVLALLALNSGAGPTMSDSVALFHANHGNLAGSSDALSVTSLGAARAAMMKQAGLDGIKLNITPDILLVSPDKLTLAEQLLSGITVPAQASNVVPPSIQRLTPVADANLTLNSGATWHCFASPAQAEVLAYGYLDGQEGPRIETRQGFEVDGVEFKIALDFTAGATDWKGAYKNTGA